MTTMTPRTRDCTMNMFKRIQRMLGPQVTTPRNAALFALSLQTLLITLLLWMLRAKDATIQRLTFAETAIGTSPEDCLHAKHEIYGLPPPENNRHLKAAIDEANYDDTAPGITGVVELKRYTTFFGRFLRCKPAPCEINIGLMSAIGAFTATSTDFGCPLEICCRSWKEEMSSISNILANAIKLHYKNDTAWGLGHMYEGNAYVRMNQYFDIEYLLHGNFMLATKNADNETVQTKKAGTIMIRRGFSYKFCDVTFNGDVHRKDEPVYIIVPYTGRIDQLRLFYQNIRDLLDGGATLRVIIAAHGGAVHILGATELLRDMDIGLVEGEVSSGHTVQVIPASGDAAGNFSRAVALSDGLAYAPGNALIFYCDVDMEIQHKFLDNCRHNTQRGHQVYYPVVYSLYPYGRRVSREHGHWRSGAYGMLCAYKSDVRRNGWAQAAQSVRGWGMEDVLLRRGFNAHWQIGLPARASTCAPSNTTRSRRVSRGIATGAAARRRLTGRRRATARSTRIRGTISEITMKTPSGTGKSASCPSLLRKQGRLCWGRRPGALPGEPHSRRRPSRTCMARRIARVNRQMLLLRRMRALLRCPCKEFTGIRALVSATVHRVRLGLCKTKRMRLELVWCSCAANTASCSMPQGCGVTGAIVRLSALSV
eukprot:IDg5263t1